MDLFAFNPATFMSFLLTFIRVSIVVFMLPFFGGDNVPMQVKGAVCLVLTLAIFPHLAIAGAAMPAHPLNLVIMLLSEAALGLCMGLAVNFIFAGIQTGGQFIGMQMGFTMVNMADPLTGAQITATATFLYMVALTVFLVFDGHLHLLRALTDSFALVPPGSFVINGNVTTDILGLAGNMFVVAIKIAAPVLAALFMVEMTLALMGRAAPQMNLMTMGFPIKIAVGFFFIGLLFTILSGYMEDVIIELSPMFKHFMRLGTAA